MRKINLIPLFIACILSACLSPSEGDDSPNEPPKLNPTSSLTTVFTATPSQTPTPEPTPSQTPDPAQIAAEEMADFKLNPADFTQKTGPNGEIQYWDGGTLISSDGAWNAGEIVGIIEKAKICIPTEFDRNKINQAANSSDSELIALREKYFKYLLNLIKLASRTEEFKAVYKDPLIDTNGYWNYNPIPVSLSGKDNCKVVFVEHIPSKEINLITFETSNGDLIVVEIFQP